MPMTSPFSLGFPGLLLAIIVGLVSLPLTDLATALWAAYGISLVCLAVIDARTGILPDVLTLPMLVLGLLMQFWPETQIVGIEASLVGMLIGSLPLWLMAIIYRWKIGKDGLGFGDVKLIAAMGAWSGPAVIPITMVLASLAGLLWSLSVMRSQFKVRRRIAFGPFLAAGYGAAVLSKLA